MRCKEYIERMKLFKAEEYLLFTDFDLFTISKKTGFSDQSHFIRCFKKFRGMPPDSSGISESHISRITNCCCNQYHHL